MEDRLRNNLDDWPNTYEATEVALKILTETARKGVTWN